MFSMAGGTDRRICLSSGYQLAVNPLPILLLYFFMTLPAGLGNIEMIDSGLWVSGRQYLMGRAAGRMTIVAGGSNADPFFCRLSVDTVFVDLDGMFNQDLVFSGKVYILMAFSTGLRKISWISFGQFQR